jgi:hypothetical protein
MSQTSVSVMQGTQLPEPLWRYCPAVRWASSNVPINSHQRCVDIVLFHNMGKPLCCQAKDLGDCGSFWEFEIAAISASLILVYLPTIEQQSHDPSTLEMDGFESSLLLDVYWNVGYMKPHADC